MKSLYIEERWNSEQWKEWRRQWIGKTIMFKFIDSYRDKYKGKTLIGLVMEVDRIIFKLEHGL